LSTEKYCSFPIALRVHTWQYQRTAAATEFVAVTWYIVHCTFPVQNAECDSFHKPHTVLGISSLFWYKATPLL